MLMLLTGCVAACIAMLSYADVTHNIQPAVFCLQLYAVLC